MIKFVILNKKTKTYFGTISKNGIKKMGFGNGPDFEVITFDDLNSANFIVQLLYDIRGYAALEIVEFKG